MRYIYKVLFILVLAAGLGTGLAASFINTSSIQSDSLFADDVINSSVYIRASKDDKILRTGTGSIIKTKISNDGDKVIKKFFILTCAHLLQENNVYNGTVVMVDSGVVIGGLELELKVESISSTKDLALLVAETSENIPVNISNKDYISLPISSLFRKKVLTSSYPMSVGPAYSEGTVGVIYDHLVVCNLDGGFGSSGGVVYDKETHKIIGVISVTIGNKDKMVPGIFGLVPSTEVEKFLLSIKSLE